jgi:glycosyltransferase involved in cell wall biosynthesis
MMMTRRRRKRRKTADREGLCDKAKKRDRAEQALMTLHEAQRERLEAAARMESGLADLMYFHALRGDEEALHALRDRVRPYPEAALLFRLIGDPAAQPPLSELTGDLGALQDPWVFHTLTKHLLGRKALKEALQVVLHYLAHRGSHPFLLNLVAKYLVYMENWEEAREIIEKSLRIAPWQRDMIVLRRIARKHENTFLNFYLDTRPMQESVAAYIPAYNVEAFIRDAIEGLIAQSCPLDEILVVDDGCTDRTLEIAAQYPVRTLAHESNRGLAAARNTAFENLEATYVCAIDTDATPDPGYIRYIMMEFENGSNSLVGVGGRLIEAHTDTPPDRWRARYCSQDHGERRFYVSIPAPDGTPETEEEIAFYSSNQLLMYGSNTVLRREAVLSAGGYDERYRTNAEDVDLTRKLKNARFHHAFTPHAIAHHQRRDTLESVLRTRWNYTYWHFRDHGCFKHLETTLESWIKRVAMSRDEIDQDWQDRFYNGIFISLVWVLYAMQRDLEELVKEGGVTPDQGRFIQNSVHNRLKEIDRPAGGPALRGRIMDEIRGLMLEKGETDKNLPERSQDMLLKMVRDFEGLLETLRPEICAIMLQYPAYKPGEPDQAPVKP